AGSGPGRFFAARKHEPAASDRSEDQRHANRSAEHGRSQIADWRCDRAARPECDRFERPAVRAHRRFVLSAAVYVVEHDPREPPLRPAPQVFDVQNPRRLNRSTEAIHIRRGTDTSLSLTPGFSPVQSNANKQNRFNGFSPTKKAVKIAIAAELR